MCINRARIVITNQITLIPKTPARDLTLKATGFEGVQNPLSKLILTYFTRRERLRYEQFQMVEAMVGKRNGTSKGKQIQNKCFGLVQKVARTGLGENTGVCELI